MANKRYFWLKLKEDFFQQKFVKKLRKMDKGDTLTIIYLKMMLASLRGGGAISFEGLADSFSDELALEIDEKEDDVRELTDFLTKYGLLEKVDGEDRFILSTAVECIGSESDSAVRMRRLREGKPSQSDARYREDKKEEKIEIYTLEREVAEPPPLARDSRGLIILSDVDYNQLCTELGASELCRTIAYLSEYCSIHNKQYHDWVSVIRKASREHWGMEGQASIPSQNYQPDHDRIARNNAWLDGFLGDDLDDVSL